MVKETKQKKDRPIKSKRRELTMKISNELVIKDGVSMTVRAYHVLPGLFIHRSIGNTGGKAEHWGNYWTLRHWQGQIIRDFIRFPSRLKDVVAWVQKNLAGLVWTLDETELEKVGHEDAIVYRDAIYSPFEEVKT